MAMLLLEYHLCTDVAVVARVNGQQRNTGRTFSPPQRKIHPEFVFHREAYWDLGVGAAAKRVRFLLRQEAV